MKKWVTIFLVLHILASSLPVSYTIAFFQISNLITHFEHHSQHGEDYHFFSFLTDHYFGSHRADSSHSHDNLPFQDHDCTHYVMQSQYILPGAAIDVIVNPMNNHPVLLINRSSLVLSAMFSGDIWQPPRVIRA